MTTDHLKAYLNFVIPQQKNITNFYWCINQSKYTERNKLYNTILSQKITNLGIYFFHWNTIWDIFIKLDTKELLELKFMYNFDYAFPQVPIYPALSDLSFSKVTSLIFQKVDLIEVPWNTFPSLKKLIILNCLNVSLALADLRMPKFTHFEIREKPGSDDVSSIKIREIINILHRFQGLLVFIMAVVTQITSSEFDDLPNAIIMHKNTLHTAVLNWPNKWPFWTVRSQCDLNRKTRERLIYLVSHAFIPCTRLTFLEIPMPFRSLMMDLKVHLLAPTPILL